MAALCADGAARPLGDPAVGTALGHVQVFDLASPASLGRTTGWRTSLVEADGAWLVLDRPGA